MLNIKELHAVFTHVIVACVLFSGGCSQTQVKQDTEPDEDPKPAVVSGTDEGINRLTDTMTRLTSKRDAHTFEVRTLKDESERQKRSGEFPPIETELDELVAIESEFRGEHAGCLAVVHLCFLASSYSGTERPVHQSLDAVLEHLDGYGHFRDLTIGFKRLVAHDGMKTGDALTRLIKADRTLPFVREAARLCKSQWQLEMVANRAMSASGLSDLTDSEDIAQLKEYLEKNYPNKSDAKQWKLDAIRELDELAASSTENHVIAYTAADPKGFVLTENTDRTNQGSTIATLAEGLSFRAKHLSIGSDAPNLNVELVSGDDWALRKQDGKLVIVQFSFKGCGPCERMYPVLRDIIANNGSEVSVLSIMADEKAETTKDAVAAGKMTWDVTWDGNGGPIATEWGVRKFPSVFFFGADKKFIASDIPADLLPEFVKLLLSQHSK